MANEAYNRYGFYPETVDESKVMHLPIAAAQTWVAGDLLFNDGGAVTIAAAATATILGPAMDNQTTPATGTLVPVYVDPDAVLLCRADADCSATILGAEIDLVGATGAQQADVGASSTDVLQFIEAVPGQTQTAAGCLIRVKINHTVHDMLQ